jgi:hypothetical protein
MRSTCRLFMAAILLTVAAGVASAQDPSSAPPPAAPEPVVTPVAELPAIPFVAPDAPAVVEPPPAVAESAPAESAPTIEPAAPVAVEQPAPEKLQVTTTTKRVTKKTATKPAAKPAIELSEADKAAAAAASMAAVDTTANPPPPAPPAVAASSTAPLDSLPKPPAAKSVTVETSSEVAIPQKKLGIGSWILFGIALVAFAGIANKFLRRRRKIPTSIVDLSASASTPGLKPIVVPRS